MTAIIITNRGILMGHGECLFYGIMFILMFVPLLSLSWVALVSFLKSKRVDVKGKMIGFCIGFPIVVLFLSMVLFAIINIIYGLL